MKPRTCGTCSACCTVIAIDELEKPACEPCKHLVQISKKGMCGVYATRPEVCRKFRCGWLDGIVRSEWRPDRVGVMVAGGAHTVAGQLIHAHETFPSGFQQLEGIRLLEELMQTHVVVRHHENGPPDYSGPKELLDKLNECFEEPSI